MDRDGTMTIDWQEWRDHFLLHSLENVEDVLYFWKHSTVSWEPPTGSGLAPASPQVSEVLGQDSRGVVSIWGSVNEALCLYCSIWGSGAW